MIMLIVVLAGVITIYSIYYVSMIHKVQEYGRLKAIGATKHQIRQIVLREGFFTAAFAIRQVCWQEQLHWREFFL